jgi:Tol biopolymer transport system component
VILQTPIWSRDGKKIAYTTLSANAIEEMASDGSSPAQVLLKGTRMIANDWSPDRHLVFMDFPKGLPSLAVYFGGDHHVTQLTAGWSAEGQFSPDGKWIAYITGSVSHGTSDIFVQPFPGSGRRIQISNAGAQPRWSRDGRQVFYVAPDRKLMAVSFDPQKGTAGPAHVLFQTRIVARDFALFQYDVSPDGRFLINSFPSSSSSPLTLLTGWTTILK